MRIFVQITGAWMTLSCSDDSTIEELIRMAVVKFNTFNETPKPLERNDILSIRRTQNLALLDPKDTIMSVLLPEEYITIDLKNSIDFASGITGTIPDLYMDSECCPMDFKSSTRIFEIDGNSMTPENLVALGRSEYSIKLSEGSIEKVNQSRALVDQIIKENRVVYGITTGFGKFADVIITPSKVSELQEALIRSHSCGVGSPLKLYQARMVLALRINTLSKGYSGISLITLKQLIDAFNVGIVPWIPLKGSVGASGDLAPLAHLALGLMGEGRVWSPKTGWTSAKHALSECGLRPLKLEAKEGLCLINGTQFITAIGAEAVTRASLIAKQADVIAAITLDVLKGTTRAFDPEIHEVRPHAGQKLVAKRLRDLLNSTKYKSEIAESHRFCNKVQDSYTLRCCPQVHGIVVDTIEFVRGVITTEMNSATDNPLVFADTGVIISGGNFHGEYPAKVLDYLAIAVHELANISERRIERLVNPNYSGLPAFLVKNGGLNSGFMIAHVTSAALVSENKVLTHPASVDSQTTSAGQEDHVSMGAFAARKALKVISNVEKVLAIELLAAVQAIDLLRPLTSTEPIEAVVSLVRQDISYLQNDRFMSPDIDKATDLLRSGQVWAAIEGYMVDVTKPKDPDSFVNSPTMATLRRFRSLGSKKL